MKEKPFAITLDVGTSLANHTGTWRTERPVYVHLMPPCNDACPAGENVQGWLYPAEEGHYEQAWRTLTDDNPFPAIMGRVCYHPCQTACNRAQLDEAVGINAVERFLGDEALKQGWAFRSPEVETGKRVLVVGAGPSGLSAAYHLRRFGHQVTVRESQDQPGGMMRYGIPTYRLPREILDAEVQRIADIGVRFEYGQRVDSVTDLLREYDAVFLAVGAQRGRRAYVPAGEAAKVMDAVELLHDMETDEPPQLGRRVAVYGGGNTALDAARTAKRLGAEEAVIVYRRTQDRMPAHDSELQEALEEGVLVKWLSTVKHVAVGSILIEKMELDENGFPQPTGETEELAADSLVLALGQESDLGLVEGLDDVEIVDGVVKVDARMMTGRPGLFAGGDMVPDDRTVTTGIGHGKQAARHIDAFLRGEPYGHPARPEMASYDRLTPWYYSEAPHQVRPLIETARRQGTFDEVVQGLDEQSAKFEARRCMSCGNCFGCDNCFGVCPDNAVRKLGTGAYMYEFDYDFCKGCGLCVAECPSGSILMVPEEL